MNLEEYNMKLFNAINGCCHHHFIDTSAVFLAEYSPCLFIMLVFYLFFNRKHKEDYRHPAMFATYAALLGLFLNLIIGLFCQHPRPFMVNLGRQLIPHAPDSSFPSDHATFTMSIAIMLIYFKPTRLLGGIALFLALLCGIARVFCGIHFPLDIAGSFVVGVVIPWLLYYNKGKIYPLNGYILARARLK